MQIATATVLEIGYAAQNGDDWRDRVDGSPVARMPVATATPTTERRAVEVQGILARRGQHRAPSVADLLVAAIADSAGLMLLHLDKDFELIASITGQAVERLRVAE